MRFFIAVFAVGLLALGVLTACNSAETKRSSVTAPTPGSAAPSSDGVRRVTVAELKDMVSRNEAFVVDVRNQASYDMGHIRGSKLIPEAEVVSHLDELPRNKLIVTYCS